ncbi:MAG: L-serine ammonia-lyase, iron-sulfur-dependent, subunit alpha [Lachnospiraceae bacterium]|nr:L-serine ammonia-lyase, iron-sulfur-dependent, subunit alpha [Lachnospiraceae bacterium]
MNCQPYYQAYLDILREELKPAMGCTEPIALAYAAAKATDVLGKKPDKVEIGASGSIIKNVKSVYVPNTGHLKGIPAAVAAGIVAGKSEKQLEVLSEVSNSQIEEIKHFLDNTPISLEHINNGLTFDIIITLHAGEDEAKVRIANYHTNIIHIEKNGEVLTDIPVEGESEQNLTDRSLLNMCDILEFANTVKLEDIKPILQDQVNLNMAIAKEGLQGNYGSSIGKTLLSIEDNVRTRARAYAAAGSDARMNGCELPVVINSGSGNQGITTSVPVIIYADELKVGEEKMYRALALSNLTTIHQKTSIGRLSAFCGAVSAAAGAGAGIAYLCNGNCEVINNTVVNTVAIVSGMVCDGAKASCAAKIAEAVDTAILAYQMAVKGTVFSDGDGLVNHSVEGTISNVGRLAKQGMGQTNEEIIDIMIEK